MIVQAFVPDWPGPKQHAAQLVDIIRPFCPVTVLDDPKDYFNAQWAKARARFTGDVMFWCMADVTLPNNFSQMYSEALRIMKKGDVGWYAPDVEWTCYKYSRRYIREYEREIYEVPNTDSLCFFVRADVVAAMPEIDPEVSFMWGFDFVCLSVARLMGLKTLRDYRFKALHPNCTEYDIDKAQKSMVPLFDSLDPVLREQVFTLMRQTQYIRERSQ